jgi:hypothetical protein
MLTTTSASRDTDITPTRHQPIHKAAREAVMRALQALRKLHAEDPFVFAALAWAMLGWLRGGPPADRPAMDRVRALTHGQKMAAVWHPTQGGEPEPVASAAPARTAREQHIENVLDLVGEFHAAGQELDVTMETIFEALDWDAIGVDRVQSAVRLLLAFAPDSMLEGASKAADGERELLAQLNAARDAAA